MLIDEIRKANIAAMKAHDTEARGAYSIVITRYQALLTSGTGVAPTDADLIHILQNFAPELDEEKEGYVKAGRTEQAEATEKQKQAIVSFLPKQLSEEEVRKIYASLEDKSMPAVMKHFKTNYAGQVDMGLVSKVARGL